MSTEDERARDPGSGHSGSPDAGPEDRPRDPEDRQSLMDQLRTANERLVVSSMQAQDLADQADAARGEAETANRLKDEFLALVSHELRTPLNSVLGWASLLGGGQLDPARAAQAIATIERNAKVLARIIDDLLDMSRIIGGTVRIDATPVDLVAVVHGALDEIHLAAAAKGLQVTVIAPTTPDPVAGEAIRLQQVVVNLLSNAVKFTPPGGHIEVRLFSGDSEAVIQVSDTGIGIAPEFLPQTFGRFTQADTSTTRQHGGLGLGLAIVRALVERHGGTVQAASEGPGRGATFTVRRPTLGSRRGGAEPPRSAPAAATAPRVRLDGVHILLVEDDADGRELLALLFQAAGARVVATGSVAEAVQALDRARPHVIVSDIGMPHEDGYALLRQVRARDAGAAAPVPAIALTGYVRPEDRARILAAGFQTHVRKPVDPGEIVAAVAALATIRAG